MSSAVATVESPVPAVDPTYPVVPESLFKTCRALLLVALRPKREKTDGGIFMAAETADMDERTNIVGRVIQIGADAFKDPKVWPGNPACKEGDLILFPAFAGVPFKIKGIPNEFRLMMDTSPLAVVNGYDVVEKV